MTAREPDAAAALRALVDELSVLREAMLEAECHVPARALDQAGADARASARNLAHFLALRSFDLRALQQRLAAQGLSSLGRAEPNVLDNLERVLDVAQRLCGQSPAPTAAASGTEAPAPSCSPGAPRRCSAPAQQAGAHAS